MEQETRVIIADLAIVGTGLAGVAATIFAMNKGMRIALTGNTGALAYTTGYLDLWGYGGDDSLESVIDPWKGVKRVRKSDPDHPYGLVSDAAIEKSFAAFVSFISECGIGYTKPQQHNLDALSPVGTVKKTLCVPKTMEEGVKALAAGKKCLIIDFKGLRGFSGRQMVANLGRLWPEMRHARIDFPDIEQKEIYPEVLARALEVPSHRERFGALIKEVKGDAEVIGMPAVLGIHYPDRVKAALEECLGIPLFEVPTMPPAVPGIRLREMVEQVFPCKGVSMVPQQKVKLVRLHEGKIMLLLADNYGPIEIEAKTVLLASGRFISGGLEAGMNGVREPLFNIPVQQPETREQWYNAHYAGAEGHLIHRAGIRVDASFRPIDDRGHIVHERLFAAGIILANQDWIRSRSGAGIAISTAYMAVERAAELFGNEWGK